MVCPISSFASDWQGIAFNGSTLYYMDYESVAPYKNLTKAWIRIQYATPQETDTNPTKLYISEKQLQYFDCKQKLMGMTAFTSYGVGEASGTVIESVEGSIENRRLKDVVPDTVGETIFKVACSSSERAKIKAMNESFKKAFDEAKRERSTR